MFSVCILHQPCQHGGTCALNENNESGYSCTCAEGYTGVNCQSKWQKYHVLHIAEKKYFNISNNSLDSQKIIITMIIRFALKKKSFLSKAYMI